MTIYNSADERQVPEEADYYFNENGLMVFTAAYHLKRGYCCGNDCKHCPYPGDMKKHKPSENK